MVAIFFTLILGDEQQHKTFVGCDDIHWIDEWVDDGIGWGVDGMDGVGGGVLDGSGGKDYGPLLQRLYLVAIILTPWMGVCP